MNAIRSAVIVAKKDLRIELRTKEILTTTGLFALLMMVLGSLGFYTDPVSANKVAPGLLWLSILFSGVLLMGRSWSKEREGEALTGLMLTPLPPAGLYLGKALSSLALVTLIELALVPIVAIFFHLDIGPYLLPLALLVFLGTLGFVATGTLFAAMSARTRARDLVISISVFPLVAPALLAAAVATRELFSGATFAQSLGWIQILVAVDIVALAAGTLLFEYLIED